jgi:signal peptidase II
MNVTHQIARLLSPHRPVGMGTFTVIAGATLLLDQLSKVLVAMSLIQRDPVVLIPGFFQLSYAENTGAAWSILTGHTVLLTCVSVVVSVLIVIWAWRLKPEEQGFRICFGLIMGGAIGNLIDRARLGYVIDFLDFSFRSHHYPTFNVADSAICIGIFLLVLGSFWPAQVTAEAPPIEKAPSGNQSKSR